MNKSMMLFPLCTALVALLTACEANNPINKPKAEQRTMIIGGMPVNDRDFKMPEKLLVEDLNTIRPQN